MKGGPGENDGVLAAEDPQSSDTAARRHRIDKAMYLMGATQMEGEESTAGASEAGQLTEKSWMGRLSDLRKLNHEFFPLFFFVFWVSEAKLLYYVIPTFLSYRITLGQHLEVMENYTHRRIA